MSKPTKPLGRKAYGSIPHLPNSRMGPADHACHEGQARIATEKVRDKNDRVIVQEKLDGSCVAVAKVDGTIHALGRAGYPASTSPFEQHHMFAHWVRERWTMFDEMLSEGERVVGEWLAQAHSTRYMLRHEPFVPFDLMVGTDRLTWDEFAPRVLSYPLVIPETLALEPISVDEAARRLGTYGHHGALDPVEGAVWRVERDGAVDFIVKWVRPDKVDGALLPEQSGGEPVWNWRAWAGAA